MSGNSIGRSFVVTSYGESHGPQVGCIVDGCPPGIAVDIDYIQAQLDRRRPGSSKFVSQRREPDRVRLVSGIFEGTSTGAPIAIQIDNVEARPQDYDEIKDKFRPGHADYTYFMKYGRRDYRGGGRASARETAARVAAGALAQQCLAQLFGVRVRAHLAQLGDIPIAFVDWAHVSQNPFSSPNQQIVPQLEEKIESLRRCQDSCGAIVRVVATGCPAGWGEPVFDRLDADLAKACMSINAVKGVEIGHGFASAAQVGSVHSDEMRADGFVTNYAGGILGGISSGADIEVRFALKPTSSIPQPRRTVDVHGDETMIATTGRHDPCVGVRAPVIGEAMVALTLLDHALRHHGQCDITKKT